MSVRSLVENDLPAMTVFTDKPNSFTTATQDFSAATAVVAPVSAGAAPTANGSVAYDSTQPRYVAGESGGTPQQTVSFARTLSAQTNQSSESATEPQDKALLTSP